MVSKKIQKYNLFVPKKIFILLSFFFIVFLASCFFLLASNKKSPALISPFIPSKSLITNHPARLASQREAGRQPPTTLVAVGDIMLGRNVNKKMHEYNDFLYPFRKVADFTAKADIAFGNLESPFFDKCPVVGSGTFTFCGDYRSLAGLKLAGFDILSLENNHSSNYGKTGLSQTIDLLTENNINYSTSNDLTIKQFNNLSLGFLSWDLTIARDRDKSSISDRVKMASKEVDVLIVSLHWGEEYKPKPAKWQVDLAHQLIDSGVKVILGHHSHVAGEYEEYVAKRSPSEAPMDIGAKEDNDGLIFYSLGNFVFDQMWSRETREGLVAKITFEGKNIKDFQTYKVLISDYSQPDFLKTP